MQSTDEESISSISSKGRGFSVSWAHDGSRLVYEAGPQMQQTLANTLLLADGRTCGKAAEDELHARLQAWIETHKQ